jgi:hypothetical protein
MVAYQGWERESRKTVSPDTTVRQNAEDREKPQQEIERCLTSLSAPG